MSIITDIFIKTLEALDLSNFNRFKLRLERLGEISKQKLKKASVDETVDLMVQVYCESGCGSVMLGILRTMDQNKLTLGLEKELQSGKLLLHSSMLSWLELMELIFRLEC